MKENYEKNKGSKDKERSNLAIIYEEEKSLISKSR